MTDPDRAVWDRVLSLLRASHPALCRNWFSELEPLGVHNGTLFVRAQSDVHRDYLQRECGDPFADAARTATGLLVAARFIGPADTAPQSQLNGTRLLPSATQTEEPVPLHANPLHANQGPAYGHSEPGPFRRPSSVAATFEVKRDLEALPVNPDFSFENFVVGPGNRLAHAAAVAIAANPGRTYNPLFVHGGVGLGKSHLLQATCLRIVEQRPDVRLRYISCETFRNSFWDAVQGGEMGAFRHAFRDVEVLVIDDIHFLAQKDRTQEEFFHTFNSLYQANKQIILSSDAPPDQIPHLEERLVSRFKWGLVAQIEPPCYETRAAIVKTKARIRGVNIADDVAGFIASRIDSNIRALEGALTLVQVQAQVDGRPIDLALARLALGEPTPTVRHEPTLQAIVSVVGDYFRIKLTDLQSKRRTRSLTEPRHVCMYLARRLTRMSLEEIGGHFGGRDHTTVMHAVKVVEERRDQSPEFGELLRQFEGRLKIERTSL